MGTGDYMCVTMSGGSPWGFRLQGGKEYQETLHVSKVRKSSKASKAGLCVGDEVVSINGTTCNDIPYSEVVTLIEKSTDSLQIIVKRPPKNNLATENQNGQHERIIREQYTESTTLQIRSGPDTAHKEQDISESNFQFVFVKPECDTGATDGEKDKEMVLCHTIAPQVTETSCNVVTHEITLMRKTEEDGQSAMVEMQLSLTPRDVCLGTAGAPTLTLLGIDKSTLSETEPVVQQDDTASKTSENLNEAEPPRHQSTTTFQIGGKQQAQIIPARQTKEACFPRVELILDCSGREKETRSQSDRGCAISGDEGGQSEGPPSTVSFEITAEDSEEGEEPKQTERDLVRPHKHRARHARLRRSESLSEKQVKEAKSKCKSIALLLTAAPNPNSKGVLMFKKRRQRARKFTLTSYGTGELERPGDIEDENDEENDDDDEENKENTFNVTFYGASESDLDDELFSDPENGTQIVTFNWDTGLVEVERRLNSGETMEELPETKGKGVLMFAKRRQRMEQLTAEHEELQRHSMEEKVLVTENTNNAIVYQEQQQQYQAQQQQYQTQQQQYQAQQQHYQAQQQQYQAQQQQSIKKQSCVSKSYIEVSNSQTRVQNGFGEAHEPSPSLQSSLNRSAKPFGAAQNRESVAFSSGRNMASPMSDLPAPPPYSSVTPPPEPRFQVSSNMPANAQAAVWTPSYPNEHIASRDERISVPANKTGILQEAKRRSTKPMFTFKEQPKVSPNPELISLLQSREGKRNAGNESGPEEDYLSLGAEACNFMQAHAGKQKTPPPVAPKPVKSPTTIPTSPVWSPPSAAPAPAVWAPPAAPAPAVWAPPAAPAPAVWAPPAAPAPAVWAPPAAPAPAVWAPPAAPAPAPAPAPQAFPNSSVWAPPASSPTPQVFSSQSVPQNVAPAEAEVAQPKYNSYNPPSTLNLAGPARGPSATGSGVNPMAAPKTPPTTPSGASAVGTAYEMPALKGKGAELFARRQSRMEKFVVDSTTVQEKAARAMSPTPSLPSSWKYSSNVRAPPPSAYNPIQSPLYPPAANKPGSKKGSSTAKKKPTKALSALEVMKHQPYQLNSSLFTFEAPSETASDTAVPKKNFLPPNKQAQFNKPMNAPASSNTMQAPANPQPSYNTQPSYQSSVFTPSSETYPVGYPMQPRQESPIATLVAPPRPKFSAKKAGVSAQESTDGRSKSFTARSFSTASSQPFASPISPKLFEPAPGYVRKSPSTPDTPTKKLSPWETAARNPLGLVDEAFIPQTLHESVSSNVVSAARRKTLPEPPASWKSISNAPINAYGHKGFYENKRYSVPSVPKSVVSAPSLQCGFHVRHPYSSSLSITNAGPVPLETRSEYGMPIGHSNFNPYPRAWRR